MSIDHRLRNRYVTERLWRQKATIYDDVRRAAAATPEKPAFITLDSDRRSVMTYSEFVTAVDLAAGNLARLGVDHGDVITLQLPNGWQLNTLILACARIGAIANPIVPIMRRREVEYIMRLTGSPMYIAPTELRGHSYSDMALELANVLPNLRHSIFVGEPTHASQLDFSAELLEPHRGTPNIRGRCAKADDLAQIIFTSGTTGEPKGVMHSHNTLYAINRAQAEALHLTSEDVTSTGAPTTHQAGYTWNLIMPLMLGSTSVHIDRWNPDLALDLIQDFAISFFMGAPTFLKDLIEAQERRHRNLSSLKIFATGSAPVPPMIVERCTRVLGCRLHSLWGMTENGCVTITRPEQPPTHAATSDGIPVRGMEVRIVSTDSSPLSEPNKVGKLQVRGAGQCLGYFRREQTYAANITEDGWFDTGDLARDDGFGGIRIAGRLKDVIIRGAENIPVVEVEGELLSHPDIKEVALVGYPDPRLGERACAVVVANRPLCLRDITRHLESAGMAKQYWPERLELRDALPRTPSGKIQKFVLRQTLT